MSQTAIEPYTREADQGVPVVYEAMGEQAARIIIKGGYPLLAGIAGYGLKKSIESYDPATSTLAVQTSETIPDEIGSKVRTNDTTIGVDQQTTHHSHEFGTVADIGFSAVPALFTAAAVAIWSRRLGRAH